MSKQTGFLTAESTMIEASFVEAIAIIGAADELPLQKRRHWATSLRQIAKALDKPLEVIPARFSAIRAEMEHLHEVPAGLTAKTLHNHKSNAKSALLWLSRDKGLPTHGAPLTNDWERLRASTGVALIRMRLSSLMRYCSANAIAADVVNEAVVDRWMTYRQGVGKAATDADRRLVAKAWNANVATVPGWPKRCLKVPPPKGKGELPWDAFPKKLGQDIDKYLEGLTRIRRGPDGRRIRPLKSSTIHTREAELKAAARMAVAAGVPIAKLKSLGALLAPPVAKKLLDAYWVRNGEQPKLYTIDLAKKFVTIALETKCLNKRQVSQLREYHAALEEHRTGGLTDKNIALIRQVMTPGVWNKVVKLVFDLMKEARRDYDAPIRAAVKAQLAIAIAILCFAPVRLVNLTAIRIGFNLIKPAGRESNYWLMFPDFDVKNRVKLNYKLRDELTEIIDEYIHDFRPALLRGRNEDWLFPGQRRGHKNKICFSGQITNRIYRATGLRITVHQFRHAAAAMILQRQPGAYQIVQLLLGHRNADTTLRAYVGFESIRASEVFGKMLFEHLPSDLKRSEGSDE
jgi:integrase